MRRVLTALAVWACVALASPPALAADRVVLQLGWDHQFQFAGFYAAQWQGYYRDAGIEVELRPGVTPERRILNAVDEVLEGRAQLGISSAAALLGAREAGKPVVVVAPILQQSSVAVFSRADLGVSAPADLPQHRLKRFPNSRVDAEFQAMLLAEGVDPGRFEFSSDFAFHRVAAIAAGTVDAFAGYSLDVPWQAKQAGIELRVLRPATYGIDFYGDTLFTTEAFGKGRADLVARVMRATVRGWEHAYERPEPVAQRIAAELPRAFPVSDKLAFNLYQADEVRRLMHYPLVQIGHNNEGRWRRTHATLTALGVLTKPFEIEPFDPGGRRERWRQRLTWTMGGGLGIAVVLATLLLGWGVATRRVVATRTASLRASESALRASEERYALAAAAVNDGIWDWHIPTGDGFLSARGKQLLGFAEGEVANHESSFFDRVHPDDRPAVDAALAAHFGERRPYAVELRLRCKDGGYRWFLTRGNAVRDDDGEPVRMLGSITDIEQRKAAELANEQAEARLRRSESHLKTIFDSEPECVKTVAADGRLIDMNPAGLRMIEAASLEQVRDRDILELVVPDDRAAFRATLEAAFRGEATRQELRIETLGGHRRWVEQHAVPLFDPGSRGGVAMMLAVTRDITERKESETRTKKSLREKETLLREIHHRVKNNLQLISSLLYFQAKRMRDPSDLAVVGETRERLRAMILVHEKLYRAADIAWIDLADYIDSLARQIVRSHADAGVAVQLNVETLSCRGVPIEVALPCGMIVSELLINACKHAFRDREAGVLSVACREADGVLEIVVADNGVGLPASKAEGEDPKFGWTLVRSLADQMGATLEVSRGHGDAGGPDAMGARRTRLAVAQLTGPVPVTTRRFGRAVVCSGPWRCRAHDA